MYFFASYMLYFFVGSKFVGFVLFSPQMPFFPHGLQIVTLKKKEEFLSSTGHFCTFCTSEETVLHFSGFGNMEYVKQLSGAEAAYQ